MIELTHSPIDTNRLLQAVSDPECGGQVLFLGTTRQFTQHPDRDQPVETDHLHYEAYEEMAIEQLTALELQAMKQWPVKKVAIVHRLGRVDPSESSVGVAVSSPHRSEAFFAAKWLIDTLKHEVPIWKQEHYVQDGAEWIHPTSGSCHCDDAGKKQPVENSAIENDPNLSNAGQAGSKSHLISDAKLEAVDSSDPHCDPQA